MASIGTSGTLITGMALLIRDKRAQAVQQADNLKIVLDVEGDDYTNPALLTLSIKNVGRTPFWTVRAYRKAQLVDLGTNQTRYLWLEAGLDYVEGETTYKWTVRPSAVLATGRGYHPNSFEVFVQKGVQYVRYRNRPLQRAASGQISSKVSRVRRELARQIRLFREDADVPIERLTYETVRLSTNAGSAP
ncbi:hypothetical protein [Geodermatophilus sp. URMC 62]|uniref:hypothetical protein n=1 Tax=Geodermatophilus sp. URMC 62 TaxID=3423414 RepID=UPI00406CAB67